MFSGGPFINLRVIVESGKWSGVQVIGYGFPTGTFSCATGFEMGFPMGPLMGVVVAAASPAMAVMAAMMNFILYMLKCESVQ